jgi:hypothetical protein
MENDFVVQRSSLKLDVTAKGLVVPTWHIYSGTTDQELDIIRKQAIDQLKKTISEINGKEVDKLSVVTDLT